jgi:hypothetical protein
LRVLKRRDEVGERIKVKRRERREMREEEEERRESS